MNTQQAPPIVVLLPNTLAHLSFELVFLVLIAFSLSSSIYYHTLFVSPSSWGETLCESEFKCDGGPQQLWHSAFECVFLQAYKQFGNSIIVGGTIEIPVYQVR